MTTSAEQPDVADLLRWCMRHGFAAWLFGHVEEPTVIVLARRGEFFVDVVHLRGHDRAEAARVPRETDINIFEPRRAVWHYYGRADVVLKELRALDPETYQLPRHGEPTPLKIVDHEREQVTLRSSIRDDRVQA